MPCVLHVKKYFLLKTDHLKFVKLYHLVPCGVEFLEYLLNVLLRNVVCDGLEEEDDLTQGQGATPVSVDAAEQFTKVLRREGRQA